MTRLFWTYPRGIMWLTSVSAPRTQRVAARPVHLLPVSEGAEDRSVDSDCAGRSNFPCRLAYGVCLSTLARNHHLGPSFGPIASASREGGRRHADVFISAVGEIS